MHGVIAGKPPKRRLWRMKRGGFEEVSRFSRHNVAGNRLTRRCVLLPTFPAGGKSGPPEAVPYKRRAPVGTKKKTCKEGMTGLAYERIFGGPIKPVSFCVNPFSTVEWRPFRRKEKIVLAFCRRDIYNRVKSIKGQSVRRLVRRRRNRVRSPASWSL